MLKYINNAKYKRLPPPSEARCYSLDFIRSASLFLIILFHYNVQVISSGKTYAVIGWVNSRNIDMGQLGVGIFTILSGYSLMMSAQKKNFSILDFYKRRLVRIFPSFYIAYMTSLIIIVIINGGITFQASPLTFILTLIGFDGYLNYKVPTFYLVGEWFLGAIISLYILFPFLRKAVLKLKHFSMLFFILISYFNHKFYSYFYDIDEWCNVFSLLILFCYGIYANLYSSHRNLSFNIITLIMCLPFIIYPVSDYIMIFKFAFCISIFSLTLIIVNILPSFLKPSFISNIAGSGFQIFLVHHIIIAIVASRLSPPINIMDSLIQFSISIIISILLGMALLKIEGLLFRKKNRHDTISGKQLLQQSTDHVK